MVHSIIAIQNVQMARNQVRIIGGKWKGRKIKLPAKGSVRPSLGRVRETLFNWLAGRIEGSRCLDLFAGSGALGFEALSRGARWVALVDSDRDSVRLLKENAQRLGASNCLVRRQSALGFLSGVSAADEGSAGPWDIAFLDPPFASGLLPKALAALRDHGPLNQGAWVYFETERRSAIRFDSWNPIKQGVVGDARFGLLALP